MTLEAFVDESARNTYLLCVVLVAPQDMEPIRKTLRGHLLRGTERLHMSNERDSRKKQILAAVCASSATATIYSSDRKPLTEAREKIIRALVPDLIDSSVTRVTIEEIAGVVDRDRRAFHQELAKAGKLSEIGRRYVPARNEPLLWIPDSIAWAWGKGGHWRRRIQPAVTRVVDVDVR